MSAVQRFVWRRELHLCCVHSDLERRVQAVRDKVCVGLLPVQAALFRHEPLRHGQHHLPALHAGVVVHCRQLHAGPMRWDAHGQPAVPGVHVAQRRVPAQHVPDGLLRLQQLLLPGLHGVPVRVLPVRLDVEPGRRVRAVLELPRSGACAVRRLLDLRGYALRRPAVRGEPDVREHQRQQLLLRLLSSGAGLVWGVRVLSGKPARVD